MILHFTEAVIGLEREVCVVDEDVGEMEVCVVVFRPQLDCPIAFPFDVVFYTTPDTASKFIIYFASVLCVYILFQC